MLSSCDFKQASTPFPFLRIALACCQLTAPRTQCKDGFSKLINRSDFDRLKSKKMSDSILAAEQLMSAGWSAVEASGLGMDRVALPFGRFQVRLCLHLLGKENKGREGTKHKDMSEIQEKFASEMMSSQGAVVQLPSAQGEGGQPQSSSAAASVQSLGEASDVIAIVLNQHKHVKVGKGYTIQKEDPGKVWLLTEVTATVGKLVHKPFFQGPEQRGVPHSQFKNLRLWTKPMPELIDEGVRQSLLPCSTMTMEEELGRVKAQAALYEKIKELLGCIVGLCFLNILPNFF